MVRIQFRFQYQYGSSTAQFAEAEFRWTTGKNIKTYQHRRLPTIIIITIIVPARFSRRRSVPRPLSESGRPRAMFNWPQKLQIFIRFIIFFVHFLPCTAACAARHPFFAWVFLVVCFNGVRRWSDRTSSSVSIRSTVLVFFLNKIFNAYHLSLQTVSKI